MDLSGELTFSANGTNLIYRSNLDDEIKMYYLAGYNQIFVDAVQLGATMFMDYTGVPMSLE